MQLWSNIKSVLVGILVFSGLKTPESSFTSNTHESTTSFNGLSEPKHRTYPINFQTKEAEKHVIKKKAFPLDLSESMESKEFDNYRPDEILYSVLHRSKRDVGPEYFDENTVVELDLDNVCTFDLNFKNYINIKYNKREIAGDLLYNEILARAVRISEMVSEKTLLKKIRESFNTYNPKCKDFGSHSIKCTLLRIDNFLRQHSNDYTEVNDIRTGSYANNVKCLGSSTPDLINRESIICNSSKFYGIFKTKPIFDITENSRLLRNDHLARQTFAVVMMLHEEITTSKGLKRYLFRNRYPKLIKTINELVNCVSDVNYLKSLYSDYSSFSDRAIAEKKDVEKVFAARFFDNIVQNNRRVVESTEDLLHIIAYLEKRRLMYNLRDHYLKFPEIDISTYIYVILSFIESFKN